MKLGGVEEKCSVVPQQTEARASSLTVGSGSPRSKMPSLALITTLITYKENRVKLATIGNSNKLQICVNIKIH